MIRQNKDTKKIVLAIVLLGIFFISNLAMINQQIPFGNTNKDDEVINEFNQNNPASSVGKENLTEYIIGEGVNQTVRLYMSNISSAYDNQNSFNITAPTDKSYLVRGDFNFTFQNNFTTDHVIESDGALTHTGDYVKYSYEDSTGVSNISYNPDTNLTNDIDFIDLTDESEATYMILNSSGDGTLNVTIWANFSGVNYDDSTIDRDFDWSEILGLHLKLTYNISEVVNMTVFMKDFSDLDNPTWNNVTNTVLVNTSGGGSLEYLDKMIINENLDYINPNDESCYIQFLFNRTDTKEFNVTLYEFDMESIFSFELPITNESQVALEFDLRGVNSTVNGFYAWIRYLNYHDFYMEEYQFNTDEAYSNISINPGMNLTTGGLDNLTDGNGLNSYWAINSSVDGTLNFTITANFSDIASGVYQDFDRDEIIDLIFHFMYNISLNANMTINIQDSGLLWHTLVDMVEVANTSNPHEVNKTFGNIDYIDIANNTLIEVIFNRTDLAEFNVTLFEYNLNATSQYEFPRLTDTELNITLYRANNSIYRTTNQIDNEARLMSENYLPDFNDQIDSFILTYDEFHGDGVNYFAFNTINTANLSLYNYYIIIKSNVTEPVYKLVTVPKYTYGDGIMDHNLKESNDYGSNWNNAKIMVGSHDSKQLDASSFKINVTRGYMPSDFNINATESLVIQNISLIDVTLPNYVSSPLQWGIGRWNDFLIIPIKKDNYNNYVIDLTWNDTITSGFYFNVTYNATIYRLEEATTAYKALYDMLPQWTINYTLDLESSYFDNWEFTEFWYIYPDAYIAYNLTTPAPNNMQILNQTQGAQTFEDNSDFDKIIVNNAIVNGSDILNYNGTYVLNMTSPNYIYDMHSFINFDGNLWETGGFMYGDNISISVDIQDHTIHAPENGTAWVSLFYPNGTLYPIETLNSTNSTTSVFPPFLTYTFEDRTILNLTNTTAPIFGIYVLGFFWTNGSMVGCKKKEIYISSYELNISDIGYYENLGINIVSGSMLRRVLDNYSLLIASVNETTGLGTLEDYVINQSVTALAGTFTYLDYGGSGEDLTVLMETFLQNETILNPEEIINFKTSIQNRHPFFDLNVKIKIQMVSYAKAEWIITETTSPTVLLSTTGNPGDTHEFDVDLTMPTLQENEIWNGVNAPVRKSGARTIVTVYIEDKAVGTYEPNTFETYSLLVNQTDDEFEGYIIQLTETRNTNSKAILRGFERDKCIYLPNKTVFISNLYDDYYMSTYESDISRFEIEINSEFTGVLVNPTTPLMGKSFNVSSILKTEFGDPIENKNVTLQYNNSGTWINISHQITDIEGLTTFKVDTLALENVQGSVDLKLVWQGDIYVLNITYNFTVSFTTQTNSLGLSTPYESLFIYKSSNHTFTIQINNLGDSNLKILKINITNDGGLPLSIVSINYLLMEFFAPRDTLEISIEVEIANSFDFDTVNFTIEIQAQNLISNETITLEKKLSFTVLDKNIFDYVVDYFMFIFLGLIALLFLFAILYGRHTIDKIETSHKPEETKRPRKGRYMKVSDIKTQPKTPEKKEAEEPEKPADDDDKKITKEKGIAKKRATDLDSLLKEKGLDGKKRK